MIPVQLIVVAAVGIASATGAYLLQENRYAAKLSDIHATNALALAQATENTRSIEAKWNDAMAESERVAKTRIAAMARDLAAARHVANGLRDDLSTARSALSTASPAAVLEYANTFSVISDECGSALVEMAGNAESHRLDAMKLLDAWPRSD